MLLNLCNCNQDSAVGMCDNDGNWTAADLLDPDIRNDIAVPLVKFVS